MLLLTDFTQDKQNNVLEKILFHAVYTASASLWTFAKKFVILRFCTVWMKHGDAKMCHPITMLQQL